MSLPATQPEHETTSRAVSTTRAARLRQVLLRAGLMVGGLMIGLAAAELLLTITNRFPSARPRSTPQQFLVTLHEYAGYPIYFNLPSSRIRFIYDGNPRGYFGPLNEVDHNTNSLGFRGSEFRMAKRIRGPAPHPGAVRIAFLGDSFTFGEGVRFEDTYPEQTAHLLSKASGGAACESYNFGVCGYNTTQELFMLEEFGLSCSPDLVVLGYVLNDPEPPHFEFVPGRRDRVQSRQLAIEGALGPATSPDGFFFRLRTVRALWQLLVGRKQTQLTIDHYRSIFEDSSPGWQESRRSLLRIVELCRQRNVPCCVVLFPILYELNDHYPFAALHAKIRDTLAGTSALFVDLFPDVKGQKAEDLWVHPGDQHPNEKVHLIAAEAICRELAERGTLNEVFARARAGR